MEVKSGDKLYRGHEIICTVSITTTRTSEKARLEAGQIIAIEDEFVMIHDIGMFNRHFKIFTIKKLRLTNYF